MKNIVFFKIYIALCSIYLLLLYLGYESLDCYLKPALIPLLILGVYFSKKFPTQKILLTALLFSWIGDVILLFSDIAEIYFILGLVSFLISHILYCVLFNRQIKEKIKRNAVIFAIGSVLIAIYLIGMLSVLLPSLGDLKIPVIAYASVISIMLLFAYNGLLIWKKPANQLVFFGALFFIVSDSILALNKFYTPLKKSSFIIMLTYLVAQYLIVIGVLKLNRKKTE
ncbi:putative membrane protein YhhN [Flavobacterium sp. HSC-32F16]|uniref:lysoplasmalogenase n=1 Tax=Flavobacterium sp. HSC-32F16 TaxID=2910964 RepID=UPI0020A309E7|nr:lysoplasmalogenase [Flavobacterium sp. HSC-32F16]MCP2025718.1 putative membrane protein YhhN [Flavobacterium sp. HSC-32F16]